MELRNVQSKSINIKHVEIVYNLVFLDILRGLQRHPREIEYGYDGFCFWPSHYWTPDWTVTLSL